MLMAPIMLGIGSATLALGACEYNDSDLMHTICRLDAYLMQKLAHFMRTQCRVIADHAHSKQTKCKLDADPLA